MEIRLAQTDLTFSMTKVVVTTVLNMITLTVIALNMAKSFVRMILRRKSNLIGCSDMGTENTGFKDLLDLVDGSGSDKEYEALEKLKEVPEELPALLLQKYQKAKKAKERSACVHNATRYAKDSQAAFELGILALKDKSKHTRHLACLLLAWSLREDALESLHGAEESFIDDETLEDIRAAIDAIENQNSNYFVDRDHSGMMTLNVL